MGFGTGNHETTYLCLKIVDDLIHRKKVHFEGKDIPCTINHLGRSLHEILRKAQISSSIEKIDSSMIVKLMSLCRK